MPPLVHFPSNVIRTVVVGTFETDGRTPERFGPVVTRMLKDELKNSTTYTLADAPGRIQLVLSGKVTCRIVEKTVTLPSGDVKTQTAEVAIVLTGTVSVDPRATLSLTEIAVFYTPRLVSGPPDSKAPEFFTITESPTIEDKRRITAQPYSKALEFFTITEAPTIEDKRRITAQPSKPDQLGEALLRICVRRLVADISPRKVRVKIPRPGFMGSARTRAGIDLLATDPARAVDELTAALKHNDKDAAALNALGFCNEVAGNLEATLSSYLYAAAIDSRAEYAENLERVRALLERRKRISDVGTAPKGKGK